MLLGNMCPTFLSHILYLKGGNKMKNEKYHTFGTIPIWNIKIVERGNSDTTNTQTHDH